MFRCFSLGEASGAEGCTGSEHAMAYEDKDGDLMLVGDVPWEMFISSCKRLRMQAITRHSDLQRINVEEEVLPVLVDSSKSVNLLKKGRKKKKSEKKKKQRKQSLAMKKSENQKNW